MNRIHNIAKRYAISVLSFDVFYIKYFEYLSSNISLAFIHSLVNHITKSYRIWLDGNNSLFSNIRLISLDLDFFQKVTFLLERRKLFLQTQKKAPEHAFGAAHFDL